VTRDTTAASSTSRHPTVSRPRARLAPTNAPPAATAPRARSRAAGDERSDFVHVHTGKSQKRPLWSSRSEVRRRKARGGRGARSPLTSPALHAPCHGGWLARKTENALAKMGRKYSLPLPLPLETTTRHSRIRTTHIDTKPLRIVCSISARPEEGAPFGCVERRRPLPPPSPPLRPTPPRRGHTRRTAVQVSIDPLALTRPSLVLAPRRSATAGAPTRGLHALRGGGAGHRGRRSRRVSRPVRRRGARGAEA